MSYTVSLVNPTETILSELQHKEITQKSVSLTYFLAMRSEHATDWGKVNRAIMERWSESGLQRIKKMAHAHYKKPVAATS